MKKYVAIIASFALPLATFAQQGGQTRGLDTGFFTRFIGSIQQIINMLFPLMITLAVLAFFYGLLRFVLDQKGDPKEKQDHLHFMWYGLLAIFIMVSIWGILRLAGNITGVGAGGNINASIPCVVDVNPIEPGCQY